MVGSSGSGHIQMSGLPRRPSYHAVLMPSTTSTATVPTSFWERLQRCVFCQTDNTELLEAAKEGKHEDCKRILEKSKININIQDDKTKQTALHYAARLNKLKIVTLLLEYNANCNVQDNLGNTPLHIAIHNGNHKCSKRILECDNLRVNLANKTKDTPLHLAARKGDMKIVDKLLDMNADYNAQDSLGKTVLHYTAASGHLNCCEKILQLNAENINAIDNNENTPLHLAAKAGNSDIVALLHNYHANCNLQNSFGDTPLHLAVTGSHFNCFKEIMEYDNVEIDLSNKDKSTPLHLAAKTGNSEIVGLLLECNANHNAQDNLNDTPLHKAARMGRKNVCDLILQYSGVDINIKNKKHMTPLHLAAMQNNHEVTELLLDKGANWKLRDRYQYMPIHYAAKNGCEKSCEHLMKALKKDKNSESLKLTLRDKKTPLMLAAIGGNHRCCEKLPLDNIDAVDNRGNTALFYATEGNLKKTVSFLLKQKADTNIKNNAGRTVLHQAAKNRADECLSYLLKNSNSKDLLFLKDENNSFTPLHEAIKSEALICAEILLNSGASPTDTSKDGMTPLHLAAEQGDPGISSMLLNYNIDLNKENDEQETPLHVAAMHGHKDVCKTLMRRGTLMLATNKKGRTALHLAADRGHYQVVTFLIKKGMSPLLKDDEGSTALHLAAANGHLRICQILMAKASRLILDVDKEGKLSIDKAFENKHDEVFAFLIKKLKPSKVTIPTSPKSPQQRNEVQNEERMNRFHKYMHQSLKPENYEDPPRLIAAEAIIDSEWWKVAFFPGMNTHTQGKDQYCTNFHELVNNYPSLALKAQNHCFRCPSANSGLTHDFRLFENNFCPEAERTNPAKQHTLTDGQRLLREHPVSLMVQHKRSELLQHPLTEAWLLYLWRAYIFYILTFLLIIEMLFLISLNIFMDNVDNWAQTQHKCNTTQEQFCGLSSLPERPNIASNGTEATENGTMLWMIPSDGNESMDVCYEHPSEGQLLSWFFLIVMTFIILLLEVIYLYRLRREYFKVARTVRILQVILTIILLLPIGICGFQHPVLNIHMGEEALLTTVMTTDKCCPGLQSSASQASMYTEGDSHKQFK